jgi:hypothetical protein
MWKVPVRRLDLLVNFDPPVVFILIENLFVCFFECYVHQDVAVDGRMMNKPRHVHGRCVRHSDTQPIRPMKKRNDLRRLLLVRHWRITRLSHTNTHSLIPFAPLIQQYSGNHQPELKSTIKLSSKLLTTFCWVLNLVSMEMWRRLFMRRVSGPLLVTRAMEEQEIMDYFSFVQSVFFLIYRAGSLIC